MSIQSEARRKALSYYNETYHLQHYGSVIHDELGFRLLSLFWRYALFERNGLQLNGKVLDFGSGVGQVSAALSDSVCFDFSVFAQKELSKHHRLVVERREDIPRRAFQYILCSHCLEHSPTPYQDLQEFHEYVLPGGHLVLVLPVEVELRPALQSDWNLHLSGMDLSNDHKSAGFHRLDATFSVSRLRPVYVADPWSAAVRQSSRPFGLPPRTSHSRQSVYADHCARRPMTTHATMIRKVY